jgi:acyl dehydratase
VTTVIDASIVGAEIPPMTQRVDARWLMAYAAGLGETDPRYYDTLAPAGPVAHPLFPVCYEWPALLALRERTVAAALAPRSVHATHRLEIHRPPRADDTLVTSACLVGVERRRGGVLVTARLTTRDAQGAPVTTSDYGSVYRGVALTGGDSPAPAPALHRARPGIAPDPPVGWSAPIDVAPSAAHVYTECARIWNPIHTDAAVARNAGLPAPILHGTATLALAVSCVVVRELGGASARVHEVAARFTGMVLPGSRVVVRGWSSAEGGLAFDVVDAGGRRVLSDGAVRARA